jgi:phospholipase/carboxylesterase
MKTLQTALYHRILLPERSTAERHPVVIMLHGRGSNEEDLLGIAPMLDDRFLVISARAPYEFPYGGFTWYDLEQEGSPNLSMFDESYRRLSTFLDDVIGGYPADPSRVILFGFSMGTVMSFALGLTQPQKIRAVAANSGYLPEVPSLTYRWQELAGTEFFITHGTEDPVIPIVLARRARELMAASNASVIYKEYPMTHTLGEKALVDVLAWVSSFAEERT